MVILVEKVPVSHLYLISISKLECNRLEHVFAYIQRRLRCPVWEDHAVDKEIAVIRIGRTLIVASIRG